MCYVCYVVSVGMCVCECSVIHDHFTLLLSDHVGTSGQAIIQMSYWAPKLSSKAMEDLILYLKVHMRDKMD